MTTGCVTNANFASGANLSGLNYTRAPLGPPTTSPSPRTARRATSPRRRPRSPTQAATSKLDAPGTPTAVTRPRRPAPSSVTFTAPTGTAPASYTATACTNNSMTTGCLTGPDHLGRHVERPRPGHGYYVRSPPTRRQASSAPPPPVSTNPTGASTQLNLPTITSVLPSTTTAGQMTICYTGSSNAPVGQTYTAMACTDLAMTQSCVSHTSYASGSQFTGLTAGSHYYVTITAVSSANYLAATTAPVGPTLATVQLATPGTPTLGYGTVAGSISVTATTSNGPVGQLYTVTACTNVGMTTGCVTTTNVPSGGNATGLAYTQGSPGTSYWASVVAQASTGYLGSGTSPVAGPQADTSLLNSPGNPTAASSTTTAGAITATFSNSSRPDSGELHRNGVHQHHDDDRVRDPGELHLRGPADRARAGHEVLRDHHGDLLEPGLRPVDLGGLQPVRARHRAAHRSDHHERRAVDDDRWPADDQLHRLAERPRHADLHGDGLHQRRHDGRLRLPVELRLGRPAHRAGGGGQLLRDDHRDGLDRLPRRDDGAGGPDHGARAARDAEHPDARLRHGRRLDRGDRDLLERPGRPALHREGLHQQHDDDRVRDHDRRALGCERHRPRVHAGRRGHRVLRDRRRPGLERLPRVWDLGRRGTAERHEPAGAAHLAGDGALGDDDRGDHRDVHRLSRRGTGELHRRRSAPTPR